ncbi:MAG: hypothetical protein PUC44_05955, partial [Eubacteriales bacterium]|nr:hypothetical protein [Eubacteriales bacterium]
MIVVPVYNMFVLPYADMYFQLDDFRKLAGRNAEENDSLVILVEKKDQKKTEWTEDSFYPIGVSGIVSEINPQGYVRVKTLNRINVDGITVRSDFSVGLEISKRPDIQDMDEEEQKQRFIPLRNEVLEVSSNFRWGEYTKEFMKMMDSVSS